MARKYSITCRILFSLIVFFTILLVGYYERTFTVTFDTSGGTIYKVSEIKANAKIIKPIDPVMEGFVFEGWYLNNTGEMYDFSKKVEENITLTAKWKSIV